MKELKNLLQEDEKVLWQGNNEQYLRKIYKYFMVLSIILIPFVIYSIISNFYGILEDISWVTIVGFLLNPIIMVILYIVLFWITIEQYKNLEKHLTFYAITTENIIEKNDDIEWMVNFNDVKRFDIRYKSYGGKMSFYLKSHYEGVLKAFSFKIEDFKRAEEILTDLIPNKPVAFRKGKRYYREEE